jgi:hypothetical protein
MIGRRAVIGLSLFSALLFCAFAAQSALAAKATNTTMVTCVKNGLGDFQDAHCEIRGPNLGHEEYGHEFVALNTTTEVHATNEKVTGETKNSEPAVLISKVGLTKTEITCATVTVTHTETLIHNAETDGKHTITGVGKVDYSNCIVTKPGKCKVKEPIVASAEIVGSEKLGAAENEMGVEFKGSGAEETFAEITFEGAECALKGKIFKVKGSAIGTSGPTTESPQTNKWSGATVVFTEKNSMQKLKLGMEAAEFSNTVTPTMGTSENRVALTTVT